MKIEINGTTYDSGKIVRKSIEHILKLKLR